MHVLILFEKEFYLSRVQKNLHSVILIKIIFKIFKSRYAFPIIKCDLNYGMKVRLRRKKMNRARCTENNIK